MLAQKTINNKLHSESTTHTSRKSNITIEDFIENMTDSMFKIILFIGLPYLLFVFIQFLRIY